MLIMVFCFHPLGLTYDEVLSFEPPPLDDEMESWVPRSIYLPLYFVFIIISKEHSFKTINLMWLSICFLLTCHNHDIQVPAVIRTLGRCDNGNKKISRPTLTHAFFFCLQHLICSFQFLFIMLGKTKKPNKKKHTCQYLKTFAGHLSEDSHL